MKTYIAKRGLLFVPVWLGVAVLTFALIRVVPGNAVQVLLADSGIAHATYGSSLTGDLMMQELGLDRPVAVQFLMYMGGVLRGDLGHSFWTGKPVLDEILRRIPITLELAALALVVALAIGITVGVVSAARQDTAVDYLGRVVSLTGLSVPSFFLGTMLLLLPALWFQWTPPVGYVSPVQDLGKNLLQFFLPALTLGTALSASVMRMTRSSLLEVLRQDYIRTAWAKGLRERIVIYRHALKNALIPVITIVGVHMGHLLGGTVITETIFSLPGVGRLTIEAITKRDYNQLQGNVLFLATIFLVVNLAVDLAYAWLDPRIRYR
ncbi:MAG: ABC transporter permease [Chloroflexi bacterium]|nr:ABC transporter permease [Chloroflexota bacterium]